MALIVHKKLSRTLIDRVRCGVAGEDELRSLGAENVLSIKADPGLVQRRVYVAKSPPSVIRDARTVDHLASSAELDRVGDSIDPKGWELDAFKLNPQLLWMHEDHHPPIGRVIRARKSMEDGVRGLFTTSRFHEAEKNPFAEMIWLMVADGDLPACSVGFRGLAMERPESPEQAEKIGVAWPWGIKFQRQELLELSIVTIPALASALAKKLDGFAEEGRFSWAAVHEGQRALRQMSEPAVSVAVGGFEEVDELPEAPPVQAAPAGTTPPRAPVRASRSAQESASLVESVRQVVREEMRSALATRPGQRGAEPESEPIAGERDPPVGATLEARERASGPSRTTDPASLYALVLERTIADLHQ